MAADLTDTFWGRNLGTEGVIYFYSGRLRPRERKTPAPNVAQDLTRKRLNRKRRDTDTSVKLHPSIHPPSYPSVCHTIRAMDRTGIQCMVHDFDIAVADAQDFLALPLHPRLDVASRHLLRHWYSSVTMVTTCGLDSLSILPDCFPLPPPQSSGTGLECQIHA